MAATGREVALGGGAGAFPDFDRIRERHGAAEARDGIYSPDLNPVAMADSEPETPIRKSAARSRHALSRATGRVCELFTDEERHNHFRARDMNVIKVETLSGVAA